MNQILGFELSKEIFTNKEENIYYRNVVLKGVRKIQFWIKNIMGPTYKVDIEVLSNSVCIKKGYSLLGHKINLDKEETEIGFIKAISVKHIYKTLENYNLFLNEFSRINLCECNESVEALAEKPEVCWNLNIVTKFDENINVDGSNYISYHWDNLIGLMSAFVGEDIYRKMGMI